MKKRVLHLFRCEKFTEGFIDLMNSELEFEHVFWVYGENYPLVQNKLSYFKEENVKYFPRIDIKLNKYSTFKQIQRFDLIIYHGVFDEIIINYFFKYKFLLKKLALYFWGGDKNIDGNWKVKMKKKYVIKRAAAIITIIPQDYYDIKKNYRPKGKYFCAQYSDIEMLNLISRIKKYPQKDDKHIINILVGNSATETNNHIEVLDLLSKFKDEDIKIYVPLSYGDMKYAKKVMEYGNKIFDKKMIPLTEFMTLDKYWTYISKIDIAIFNMIRQQALGNIYLLMQIGSKIYLNQKGLLWDYFTNRLQCDIGGVDEIDKISFQKFIEFSEKNIEKNRKKVNESFSRDNSIYQWKKIFSSLSM